MKETANRYRNIIAAIDNLLIQLAHKENSSLFQENLKIIKDIYVSEMEFQKENEANK